MQKGDRADGESSPWDKRIRVIPLRTYSGKVIYKRKPHYFTMDDAARIIRKIEPPPSAEPSWYDYIIETLRAATISMLNRILFFLPPKVINQLYEFGIDLLDRMFQISDEDKQAERNAVEGIRRLAQRAGVSVEITLPKE